MYLFVYFVLVKHPSKEQLRTMSDCGGGGLDSLSFYLVYDIYIIAWWYGWLRPDTTLFVISHCYIISYGVYFVVVLVPINPIAGNTDTVVDENSSLIQNNDQIPAGMPCTASFIERIDCFSPPSCGSNGWGGGWMRKRSHNWNWCGSCTSLHQKYNILP